MLANISNQLNNTVKTKDITLWAPYNIDRWPTYLSEIVQIEYLLVMHLKSLNLAVKKFKSFNKNKACRKSQNSFVSTNHIDHIYKMNWLSRSSSQNLINGSQIISKIIYNLPCLKNYMSH